MEGFERRVSFQAALQRYVDHGISSTINLPAWGSEINNPDTVRDRAQVLYRYLPALRGLTCYTDGSRGGQPLTPVKFSTAMQHVGQVFVEAQDICEISKTGGNCG
jgi:ribonucleoside-diphosphate reductase alpha chain